MARSDRDKTIAEWEPYAAKLADRYAGRRTHPNRDDLFSEALVAAWRAIEEFDGTGRRNPFVAQRMERRVIDRHRALRGREGSARQRYDDAERVFIDERRADDEESYELPAGGPGPCDAVVDADEFARKRRTAAVVLDELNRFRWWDDRCRDVVHRRYIAGESQTAIARDLGVDPSRVSQLLTQFRNGTAKVLAEMTTEEAA